MRQDVLLAEIFSEFSPIEVLDISIMSLSVILGGCALSLAELSKIYVVVNESVEL